MTEPTDAPLSLPSEAMVEEWTRTLNLVLAGKPANRVLARGAIAALSRIAARCREAEQREADREWMDRATEAPFKSWKEAAFDWRSHAELAESKLAEALADMVIYKTRSEKAEGNAHYWHERYALDMNEILGSLGAEEVCHNHKDAVLAKLERFAMLHAQVEAISEAYTEWAEGPDAPDFDAVSDDLGRLCSAIQESAALLRGEP